MGGRSGTGQLNRAYGRKYLEVPNKIDEIDQVPRGGGKITKRSRNFVISNAAVYSQ